MPKHFFIDESGRPEFYANGKKLLIDQPGYSNILLIGMIEVEDRKKFREQIKSFMHSLLIDESFKNIKSLHDPTWYLHAAQDHDAVSVKFFEFISTLHFKTYIIIGRKELKRFHNKHKGKVREFYFDLVKHLTKNLFKYDNNFLCLASRSTTTMSEFSNSLKKALDIYKARKFSEDKIERTYKCIIESAKVCLELSVTDYMLWALYRYITKKEDKYYKIIENKYCYIEDLYDNKHFNHKNNFSLEKVKPFPA